MADCKKLRLRIVPDSLVEQELIKYIKAHPGVDAFDAAIKLKLDPSDCIRIANNLVRQGILAYDE
jgi:DNA-binding IclR family transcriptional regulator